MSPSWRMFENTGTESSRCWVGSNLAEFGELCGGNKAFQQYRSSRLCLLVCRVKYVILNRIT